MPRSRTRASVAVMPLMPAMPLMPFLRANCRATLQSLAQRARLGSTGRCYTGGGAVRRGRATDGLRSRRHHR